MISLYVYLPGSSAIDKEKACRALSQIIGRRTIQSSKEPLKDTSRGFRFPCGCTYWNRTALRFSRLTLFFRGSSPGAPGAVTPSAAIALDPLSAIVSAARLDCEGTSPGPSGTTLERATHPLVGFSSAPGASIWTADMGVEARSLADDAVGGLSSGRDAPTGRVGGESCSAAVLGEGLGVGCCCCVPGRGVGGGEMGPSSCFCRHSFSDQSGNAESSDSIFSFVTAIFLLRRQNSPSHARPTCSQVMTLARAFLRRCSYLDLSLNTLSALSMAYRRSPTL
mmetsp:Transcript_31280/g.77493  ORF Transcript_31280/g.77493 Transcript_31280/m.77493 type:complete len:280 (-) Transcript_31280:1472-2311(-)